MHAKDTVAVTEKAIKNGAMTIAVTNNQDSPIANMCDFHLFMDVEEEKSVAATKTYIGELVIDGRQRRMIFSNAYTRDKGAYKGKNRSGIVGTCMVVISQSGMSKDTVAVTEKAIKNGAMTIAVTNSPLNCFVFILILYIFYHISLT